MAEKRSEDSFTNRPFQDLKRILDLRKSSGPPAPPPRNDREAAEEDLFRKAMEEVTEIREFRNIPFRRKSAAPLRREAPDASARRVLEGIVSGATPLDLRATQEYVEWTGPGCRGNTVRRLQEGGLSVQDCLDLHGFTVSEAEAEVEAFIKLAVMRKFSCVKIIHGRGLRSPRGPVLKEALIKWLSLRFKKNVIAFSSARQRDGGLGAVYVLLR